MTQRTKDVHASFLDNAVQTATSHCPVHAMWPLVLLFDDKILQRPCVKPCAPFTVTHIDAVATDLAIFIGDI